MIVKQPEPETEKLISKSSIEHVPTQNLMPSSEPEQVVEQPKFVEPPAKLQIMATEKKPVDRRTIIMNAIEQRKTNQPDSYEQILPPTKKMVKVVEIQQ